MRASTSNSTEEEGITELSGTHRFVVEDPRSFDGDPFDVAKRSFEQAASVAEVLEQCIASAEKQARNAQMTRNLQEDEDHAGTESEWTGSPLGMRLNAIQEKAGDIAKALERLGVAAAFNPRARKQTA